MTHSTDLKDILARRGVNRIAYFHTDHFEPWREIRGRNVNNYVSENAEDVARFGERMNQLWYGRRLTLFYWPNLGRSFSDNSVTMRLPGDPFAIKIRTDEEDAICQAAIRGLVAAGQHEFQVHMHHEYVTQNEMYCRQAPEFAAYFDDPANARFNLPRYDMTLAFVLDKARGDTGLPLEQWFFVHGMWALNASDLDVCTVTDEIERLMRRGCIGDFTFPAGRQHCDPVTFKEPSLVRPVNAVKGYDSPAAQARPAWGAGAQADDRFFIWSDRVAASDASIDFYSDAFRTRAEDVPAWAGRLLEKSHVSEGTLYLKTHAHSMFSTYFENVADPFHPHEHPAVRELFDRIAAAGAPMDFLTASEVHAEVLAGEARAGDVAAHAVSAE